MSTSSRRHGPVARLTRNATLTGAVPPTVADAAQRLESGSPLTTSFGLAGRRLGIGVWASRSTAVVAETGTVSTPAASLRGAANGTGEPWSCDQIADGVEVVKRALAGATPLLKTATSSRFDDRVDPADDDDRTLRVADDRPAGREPGMLVAQRAELLQLQLDRVRRHVERGALADRRRADALLRLPVGHLRREHVLPRGLVAAAADHPDLVAVVDGRRAAQEVQERRSRGARASGARRRSDRRPPGGS